MSSYDSKNLSIYDNSQSDDNTNSSTFTLIKGSNQRNIKYSLKGIHIDNKSVSENIKLSSSESD